MTCPSCGAPSGTGARFCPSCGTALATTPPAPGVRKTVTVVFCDLVESTALSERLDPERLRAVMLRYYDLMAERLRQHGGAVEKFIGDAVVAVFGVPVVREDDALRAVRAALDMCAAMADLNREVTAGLGVRVAVRIGVNTGEVFASGDPAAGQVLTSGEAVNVAARLQQHAGRGEVLIGPETHRLVAPFAVVEPVGPLTVKGKSEPVEAWRVREVDPDASGVARRFDGPFVGREDELARLGLAMRQMTRDRSAQLVTVLGDAGVGKSRLARELLATVAGQPILAGTGRCRPDRAGGSLHAVAEAVTELLAQAEPPPAAGAAGDAVAEAADAVAVLRRGMLRDGTLGNPPEDTYWALTRLLDYLSARQPVVVVVDDLHWAGAPLLDALDHLAEWVNGPVMLLCLARVDLLDHRPNWGNLRPNAMSCTLPPLGDGEAEQLLAGLLDVVPHTVDGLQRIVRRAEGNPLFLEHLAAMMCEGGADGVLPRSIHLLLAARLDRLSPAERQTLESATIVGREFTVSALHAVRPEPDHLASLRTLHRKRLVTPVPGGGRFRFASGLVQETAYASMPKRMRSDLHERFAEHLAATQAPPADVGGHLERAYRLRIELGHHASQCRRTREAAARYLSQAGAEALARSDLPWAENLLERALTLLDEPNPDPTETSMIKASFTSLERREGRPDHEGGDGRLVVAARLVEARIAMGDGRAGPEQLRQLMTEAVVAGDHRLAAHLRLTLTYLDPRAGQLDDAVRAARAALPVFESAGDELGMARAWLRIGQEHQVHGRYGAAARILERALDHAERAGAELELAALLGALAMSLWLGPEPVPRAVERCRDLLARYGTGRPAVTAAISCPLAGLLAASGEFAEARTLLAGSRRIATEISHAHAAAAMLIFNADVEVQAGRPDLAEELLREAAKTCARLGDRQLSLAATTALARVRLEQGRPDAAQECLVEPDLDQNDLPPATLTQWCGISARAAASAHDPGGAARAWLLADLALTMARHTDSPSRQARALLDRAWVAHLLGDPAGRAAAISAARDLLVRKGDLVGVARVDAWRPAGLEAA